MKRLAVKRLVVNGKEYGLQVLEMEDNKVLCHYPLVTELPQTEWYGGTVVVNTEGKIEKQS